MSAKSWSELAHPPLGLYPSPLASICFSDLHGFGQSHKSLILEILPCQLLIINSSLRASGISSLLFLGPQMPPTYAVRALLRKLFVSICGLG